MEFDEEEARRDDAFYDELERAYIAELEHVRAGGVDLTKAILREEVYERLIGELEREDVSSDARDAVASFLQDLRRDGVDWHWIGDGGEFFDKESFFRTVHAGACMRAARIMGSGCLKFAREHVAPWDEWTCTSAAMKGNLDCLKYAHENGCPWNENTCIAAASNGHLDCLKYAHENGCPWNVSTCQAAAEYGHLDCLRYAHENGCCWDKRTCEGAAKYGQLECLKYACARKCPGSDRYAEALNEVIIPDVDESFGVDVALEFQRANDGEISMREFLPLWVAHREGYRDAHLEVVRNLIAHD